MKLFLFHVYVKNAIFECFHFIIGNFSYACVRASEWVRAISPKKMLHLLHITEIYPIRNCRHFVWIILTGKRNTHALIHAPTHIRIHLRKDLQCEHSQKEQRSISNNIRYAACCYFFFLLLLFFSMLLSCVLCVCSFIFLINLCTCKVFRSKQTLMHKNCWEAQCMCRTFQHNEFII